MKAKLGLPFTCPQCDKTHNNLTAANGCRKRKLDRWANEFLVHLLGQGKAQEDIIRVSQKKRELQADLKTFFLPKKQYEELEVFAIALGFGVEL